MNEREELRMIRERIEQAQDALAEIEGAARRAAGLLAALAGGAIALLMIAAWALLRLVALAG